MEKFKCGLLIRGKVSQSLINAALASVVELRIVVVLLFLLLPLAFCQAVELPEYNKVILKEVHSMPLGGGYQANAASMRKLQRAVVFSPYELEVKSALAEPSFCSGATYLVFLKTLLQLQAQRKINFPSSVAMALVPSGEPDGKGIWGRWNANGPGVARLFYTLGLGPSFHNLEEAQPGDFLKIFWNNHIGVLEHGHLVIYLGKEEHDGKIFVRFWSSNIPKGYGEKVVPLRSIHFMIFSRLTHPEAILNAMSLAGTDAYLASLLSKESSQEEAKRLCGIVKL